MKARGASVAIVAAAVLAACGETVPPATPALPTPVAASPAPAAAMAAPVTPVPPIGAAGPIAEETKAIGQAAAQVLAPARPTYQVRARRDPFDNLEIRIQERETMTPSASMVTASKLTGIVRGQGELLALVETAQGMGYILKAGDTLGDGRVVEIGADQVIFSVPPKPGSATNRVVLKIAKD